MKIIKLKAQNFMRLVAFEYSPTGNVIKITGKNGAGKSAVLNSICAALGGKKAVPQKPIRDGQSEAEIVLETDEYVVRRWFTETTSYLEVRNADGAKIGSPQVLLDRLFGDIATDPLKWVNEDKTEKDRRRQRETLLKLVGVDLTELDQEIEAAKGTAQLVRRDIEQVKPDAARYDPALPDRQVDTKALVSEIEKGREHNRQMQALVLEQEAIVARMDELKRELSEKNKRRLAIQETLGQMEEVDVQALTIKLEAGLGQAQAIANNQAYGRAASRLAELNEKLDRQVTIASDGEARKLQILEGASFPVQGLGVTDEGVVYNGIPLAQVNHAKKLEIGMAVQMALNPKLRVMLVDGNGLDSGTLAALEQMANGGDYQVWMEIADESGQVGVVIEDGRMKGGEAPHEADQRIIEATPAKGSSVSRTRRRRRA